MRLQLVAHELEELLREVRVGSEPCDDALVRVEGAAGVC